MSVSPSGSSFAVGDQPSGYIHLLCGKYSSLWTTIHCFIMLLSGWKLKPKNLRWTPLSRGWLIKMIWPWYPGVRMLTCISGISERPPNALKGNNCDDSCCWGVLWWVELLYWWAKCSWDSALSWITLKLFNFLRLWATFYIISSIHCHIEFITRTAPP